MRTLRSLLQFAGLTPLAHLLWHRHWPRLGFTTYGPAGHPCFTRRRCR